MHIAIYNDTIGSSNFGCQLVSHSLRRALTDIYPDSSLEFIPMGELRACTSIPDLIIINGEGSFGHITAIPAGFDLLRFVLDSYKGKAPIYLVNTSVQVPLTFISQAENLLKQCDLVTLRESLSYNFLKENTSLSNLKVFPDLGTYYFKDREQTGKDVDITFGLGAILKFIRPTSIKIKEYVEIFNELAQDNYSIAVLDFPGNPMSDLKALSPFLSPKILNVNGTFEDYFNIVSRAKLNVTGRHHGAVMSFIGRTPFYTFESNMWKTEGDQLIYGPFDSFTFTKFEKEELKSNIVKNLNKFSEYTTLLNSNYNTLKYLFDGHIRVTRDNSLTGL